MLARDCLLLLVDVRVLFAERMHQDVSVGALEWVVWCLACMCLIGHLTALW